MPLSGPYPILTLEGGTAAMVARGSTVLSTSTRPLNLSAAVRWAGILHYSTSKSHTKSIKHLYLIASRSSICLSVDHAFYRADREVLACYASSKYIEQMCIFAAISSNGTRFVFGPNDLPPRGGGQMR